MPLPAQRAEALIRTQQSRVPLLYIGGLGVESEGSATIQICNPADGHPFGRCPAANERDVHRAVKSARSTFYDTWCDVPAEERASILLRAATILEREGNDLAILESLQTGKTYREALTQDISSSVQVLRYYAGWATKRGGRVHDLGGGFIGYTHTEPHPVVAALLGWESPLANAVWKLAAAVAAGSCIVIKPSELTPLTTLRFAELMREAGLPNGVFNVVTGYGHQAGEALAKHGDVGAIGFVGSIESARHVMVSSAKSNLKPVHLRLGGKSANIVFEDADLKRACQAVWKAAFNQRGQLSTSGSRLLVHQDLYEQVTEVVTDRARELSLGDPLDEHTDMGPLISETHMKRALGYIDIGRREGARLVAGGMRDVDGARAAGFFVRPTVFIDVEPGMRIAQEQILGPVLTVSPFKNEDEAVSLANATDYGMASALWTRDLGRAHRVSRRLQTGVVWVNHYDHIDPALPFGGTALSGQGRDLGAEGLEQFSFSKAVYVPSR